MARGTSEMFSRVDSAIDQGILRATRDLDFQLDNFSEDTSFFCAIKSGKMLNFLLV